MKKIMLVLMIIFIASFIYGCSNNTEIEVSITASPGATKNGSIVNLQDNCSPDSIEATEDVTEENLFELLPSKFGFSSGAGGWYTIITLNNDGTFEGQYIDSDMGSTGIGYSHGTTYKSNFAGKFCTPEKINEYIYLTELIYLKVEETPGTEYIENDTLYICTEPYGFDKAESFLIYLPGCPLKEVSEDYLSWTLINSEIRASIPVEVFGIYNVGGKEGFVATGENFPWLNKFTYNYGSYKSELHPSYRTISQLIFWSEAEDPILKLSFNWVEDKQMEFIAIDANGTGEYLVSFEFSKDYSSITVTLQSLSEYSMAPWGGSDTGFLKAEYKIL